MTKQWRLTRHAEEALYEIVRWTLEHFGERQAQIYEDELLDRCDAIAAGTAFNQNCSALVDDLDTEELYFTRSGSHVIIYYETDDTISILDFLHGRTDLQKRIKAIFKPSG